MNRHRPDPHPRSRPAQTASLKTILAGRDPHMTLCNRGRPAGFSKVVAPLVEPATRRANREVLAKLKAILESRLA